MLSCSVPSHDLAYQNDKTKLKNDGPKIKKYVWHKKVMAYDYKKTIPKVKHGGGSSLVIGVLCWCFAATVSKNLDHATSIINSLKYHDILAICLM